MIFLSPEAVSDIERLREFLGGKNPGAARRALATIWNTLEVVEAFPDIGRPTEDAKIRQVVIRFGAVGYISRYTVLPESSGVLVLRI